LPNLPSIESQISDMGTEKTCFIIAPIGAPDSTTRKRSDDLIKFIINPVVEALHYTPIRADKIAESGMIGKQVIQRILKSSLVIADLTERNPNVFYELAIRHIVRGALVHMIKQGEDLPFDIAAMRAIEYPQFDTGGTQLLEDVEKTKKELEKQIQSMGSEKNFQLDTPISAAIDDRELFSIMRNTIFYERTRLSVEPGYETDVLIKQDNVLDLKGKCRWFHVKLVNPNPEEMAKDCFANIVNTKDLRTGNIKNLNSSLKWEESNETKLTVPQDSYKQFDAIVTSEERPSIAFLGLNWFNIGFPGPNKEQYTLEGPGEFELNFVVYSDNFPNVSGKYLLHLGDKIEDAKLQKIS
jgi:hypothetical protein